MQIHEGINRLSPQVKVESPIPISPFPVLDRILKRVRPPQRSEIVKDLGQLTHSENTTDLGVTLNNIFSVDAADLIFFRQGGNDDYLGELLSELVHNPGILRLLPFLCQEVEKQDHKVWPTPIRDKMALSFLLSQLNLADAPNALMEMLGEVAYQPYDVKSSKEGWYLCPNSENLLQDSIEYDSLGPVLVDDVMLVKLMNGKTTGICLYPVATPTGLLLPGTWYSPDGNTRNEIEQAYEEGVNKVTLKDGGTWFLMRPLKAGNLGKDMSSKKVLQSWQDHAASL